MNDYSDTWWQQYIDCTPGYTCADCKHASYYPASFWYPWYNPYCAKGRGVCKEDKTCNDFELIGRLSR